MKRNEKLLSLLLAAVLLLWKNLQTNLLRRKSRPKRWTLPRPWNRKTLPRNLRSRPKRRRLHLTPKHLPSHTRWRGTIWS